MKDISSKKRHTASHLLLFMISDELPNYKPCAIPVRVVKYKRITDAKLRELKEELRYAMNECGILNYQIRHYWVLFISKSEHNYIVNCFRGQTRPELLAGSSDC